MNEKRWYDRQPRLAQAVRALGLLPEAIKVIVCEAVMLLAQREFRISEQLNSFRTLGGDKVMGLHKSKNRRRDYDQCEVMHKLMTYFYILENASQDLLAAHVLKLMGHIQEYLTTCKEFSVPADMEAVARIAHLYVEQGSAQVACFLAGLRERLRQGLDLPSNLDPEDFVEQLMGMKISGGNLKS